VKESFSYSEYSAAMRCLRLYKQVYLDGHKGTSDNNPNLLFGSAMHEALNTMLKSGPEQAYAVFDLSWGLYEESQFDWGRWKWADLKSMGVGFLDKFAKFYHPKMSLISGEKRLYGAYKGIKLEGTPDAVVAYEGMNTLVDFKTSAWNYDKDKATVSLQLYLYAVLCEQNGIQVDRVMYLPFIKGTGSIQTPIIEAVSQEKCNNMLDDMVEYIMLLRMNTSFPRNPNSCIIGAQKCEHFNSCWGPNAKA